MKKHWKFSFQPYCFHTDTIIVTQECLYSPKAGYGFDFNTTPRPSRSINKDDNLSSFCTSDVPFYFSVKLPEGNYEVCLVIGDKELPTNTTVRAESRRLMIHDVNTRSGEFKCKSFGVNVREAQIDKNGRCVLLNEREYKKLNWDGKLTLEFNGKRPSVCEIEIKEKHDAITLFLTGNSTAVDQDDAPYCSWGQMITKYFKSSCIIANYAESGLSLHAFIKSRRLEKILSVIKPGDYVVIEFGHIDKKDKTEDALGKFRLTLIHTSYVIDKKGGVPILVTPASRRYFNPDGSIANTLGDYPEMIRNLAKDINAYLIDLNSITKFFFEELGEEGSKKAFAWYPANTWLNQPDELKDNTHLNTYGAYEIARLMLKALAKEIPELPKHINYMVQKTSARA